MPANGYNVGRDARLDITTALGGLDLPGLTGFDSKQETVDIKVRPLNRPPVHIKVPDGWTGTFDIERTDSTLDDYFASEEDGWWTTGTDPGAITIQETITNPDGSISQYLYTGVVLKYDDTGAKKAEESIKQKVSFWASRRIKQL